VTVSMRRHLAVGLAACSLVACDGTLQFSGTSDTSRDAGPSADGGPRTDGESDVLVSDVSLGDDASKGDATAGDAPLDRRIGLAPPCYKGTDCPVDKLHCDLDSNECVECLADLNCTVMPYLRCMTSVHRCVECLTESDCTPGSVCHATTHICLHLCADGGACPATLPYCDPLGFCAECRSNADCAQADLCDRDIGRCAFCAMDRSCGATAPYCDPYNPGRSRCKECLDPSECPVDRPYCDVHGRVCVSKI